MRRHLILGLVIAGSALLAPAALAQDKPAPPKPAPPAAKGVRTVEIFGTDDMKYSVADIAAKPGEQIRIVLVSKGTLPKVAMAHNWVLLKKEASPVKFVQAGATHRDADFIAPETKDQVIAKTGMIGPGEKTEVTFKVPAAAGSYPYLCTFVGHFQAGMRGNLVVK
jgi:azurin